MFRYRLYDNRIVISNNNSPRTYNGGTLDKEPIRYDEKEKRQAKKSEIDNLSEKKKEKKERRKTIKLNKKKLKDRACVMAKLKQSKRFMAFYSISFPLHMAEDEIYKAFNYWLTNCRKYYKLDTYLWVSEYQENGTVHYHLLTNNYMRIQDVNRSMAVTLHNMGYLDGRKTTYINRKTKQEVKGILTLERFNGVHVDEVKGDKMKVIG